MTIKIDGKRAIEIPFSDVSRSILGTAAGAKGDVSLEFHNDDTTADVLQYFLLYNSFSSKKL